MKKSSLVAIGVFVIAVLYFLYIKGYIFANFESVTPRQAYEMIQSDPNVVVLDVRTPEEYAQGHIEGAKLVPVQKLDRYLGEGKLEREKRKKLLVYCRSGVRSVMASRKLADHAFQPYNIKGGINAWRSERLPTTR